MKRRFTEEQIIGVLREQEAGGTVKEITRRHGVSEQSFYRWKAKVLSSNKAVDQLRVPTGLTPQWWRLLAGWMCDCTSVWRRCRGRV